MRSFIRKAAILSGVTLGAAEANPIEKGGLPSLTPPAHTATQDFPVSPNNSFTQVVLPKTMQSDKLPPATPLQNQSDVQLLINQRLLEVLERTGPFAFSARSTTDKSLQQLLMNRIRDEFGVKDGVDLKLFFKMPGTQETDPQKIGRSMGSGVEFELSIGDGKNAAKVTGTAIYGSTGKFHFQITSNNFLNKDTQSELEKHLKSEAYAKFYTTANKEGIAALHAAKLALSIAGEGNFIGGKKIADPQSLLLDSKLSLTHLGTVYNIIEENWKKMPVAPWLLDKKLLRADAALWVTRWLSARDKMPTEDNVAHALLEIENHRLTDTNVPLFYNRRVVVAADAQSQLQLTSSTPESDKEIVIRRGDVNVFGTRRLISDLRAAVGEHGDLEVIRIGLPIEQQLTQLFTVFNTTIKTAPVKGEKAGNVYLHDQPILKQHVRHLLGVPADKPMTLTIEREQGASLEIQTGSILVESGGTELVQMNFRLGPNKPGFEISSSHVALRHLHPAVPELSGKKACERILQSIEETPPGPNGFLFIQDGHMEDRTASLFTTSVSNSGGLKSNTILSVDQIAGAFLKRAEKFNTSGDIIFLTGCKSADFMERLCEKFVGSPTAPRIYTSVEYGQLGVLRPEQPISSPELEHLLREAKKLPLHQQPTIRDLIGLFGAEPKILNTNPTMYVPRMGEKNGKKVVVGFDQIATGIRERGRNDSVAV